MQDTIYTNPGNHQLLRQLLIILYITIGSVIIRKYQKQYFSISKFINKIKYNCFTTKTLPPRLRLNYTGMG